MRRASQRAVDSSVTAVVGVSKVDGTKQVGRREDARAHTRLDRRDARNYAYTTTIVCQVDGKAVSHHRNGALRRGAGGILHAVSLQYIPRKNTNPSQSCKVANASPAATIHRSVNSYTQFPVGIIKEI